MIARGALLRAIHSPVRERLLTQSYGIRRDEEWDPEVHGRVATVIDRYDGFRAVTDRMAWFNSVVGPFLTTIVCSR